ncbi:hypothetical protein [Leptospira andrefontaineae]|uniref:Uncharacterized protein n=1 Tax=Leptospira andrefontaineae TaxID=2484976 RepID=A0A4R9GZR4_9LEPT|nr:hypothetical protein [Leptospira andrefontaineae]TGK37234.1 hypothetical protein EHO65_16775 [Leptospira andrefontaineae]
MITTNNLASLCPTLIDIFTDQEVNNSEIDSYNRRLSDARGSLGRFSNYIAKLHDSSFKLISNLNSNMVVLMKDKGLSEKADKIAEENSINMREAEFPLTIRFLDCLNVRLYKVTDKGFLKRANPNELALNYTYLYDELIEVKSGRVLLAIVIFRESFRRIRDPFRILLIDTSKIEIIEDHENLWKSYFDGRFLNDFHNYRNELVYLNLKNDA